MPRRGTGVPPWLLHLDSAAPAPYYRQLYEGLRASVLEGRLAPGVRLPSTRELAAELGVSRSTVVSAYRQLLAEGYLEGRGGSGTYVATALPDDLLRARKARKVGPSAPAARRAEPSGRGGRISAAPAVGLADAGRPRAFRPWVPALDEFPWRVWSRLSARRLRWPSPELLSYGDPAGYFPLRRAIAEHLGATRAMGCVPEQVIVVSGSQQAIDLAARVLLDPGDAAWVEDPGYAGTSGALEAAGAEPVPVPVDDEGMDVAAGAALRRDARLACVTPSFQYPLGATMSLRRRLALLEWAGRRGSWVLENDYDSEYRYSGRPLAAMQGLDDEDRVVYAGTFSKVILPALRLAYLVAPPALVDSFVAARTLADRGSSPLDQAILTDFLVDGHFASHVRRTRTLYAERQELLVDAARRDLAGLVEVPPKEAGMHLVGWLPEGADDVEASRRADAEGVEVPALSGYAKAPLPRKGLVLGYAAVGGEEITAGVRRLRKALGRPQGRSGSVDGRPRR